MPCRFVDVMKLIVVHAFSFEDVPQIYGSLSQHLEVRPSSKPVAALALLVYYSMEAAVRKCSRAGGGHAYEDRERMETM